MADHTQNGLRAAVKALTDVIAPAIDVADPLAREQLRLVVDYLEFLRGRLDLLHDRERFELRHALKMACSLQELRTPASAFTENQLASAIKAGKETDKQSRIASFHIRTAAAALEAAVRVLVHEAKGFDEASRRRLERCVLDNSEERIIFERSWYFPMGFDPSPGEVLSLRDLLDQAQSNAGTV